KLRKEAAQRQARTALKNGERDVADLLDIDEPEKPVARRYVTNDTTYEALGEILADNPNGVLAFRDELVSLLKTLDREEYAAARGFFLTAWNGTTGYSFDRISRGKTYIEAVCLSLLGSTQPGRIAEYMGRAIRGGAGDDGLIQRFSLLVWPDHSGDWHEVDRFPNTAARQNAWDTFDRLDKLIATDIGAETDTYATVPYLRFDPEGLETFAEWRAGFELRIRSGSDHAALESHLAKYRKLVPTLALINHLADGGAGPIGGLSTLRALTFAEYLESHARRAYGSGFQAEAGTAKAILARIRKGDLADGFTARDILQREWSNLSDRDQVITGLELLDDLSWLRSTRLDTGGRPKIVYSINPRGFE
ncbi:MAG: DUF3987 domain-containing protein, partial [Methylobacteriaceae bacterium]|nr:DUF3987 domain-containing protein [Methylobacteriaceae bacterium]